MRLIDADALKENCYKKMDELMESTSEHLSAEALSLLCGFTLIDSAPSIDIEPKQGEWIVYEGGWKDLDYYPPKCKCNQCGYEEELYILNAKPTNFCSNCGAKMKGANDE